MVTFVINLLILIANVSRNVERLVKRVDILIFVELLYFYLKDPQMALFDLKECTCVVFLVRGSG